MKIQRKTILFLILFFLLIGVMIWFFFFLNKTEQGEISEQAQNLFPFGKVETGSGGSGSGTQGTIGKESGSQETGEKTPSPKIEAGPRLRQISDFPTGGFAPIIREEDKEVTDISIDSSGVSSQTVQTIKVENPYVRYSSIEDASIFETALTPYSVIQTKLVKNFIPNAEYAFFNADGTRAAFQYWNNQGHFPETYLAKISPIELKIDACPYDFSHEIILGNDNKYVLGLHQFLNRNPRTQVSQEGVNAPGNESSLAIEETITAIKNFQSLYDLEIDGKLGKSTARKMLEICDVYMKKEAQERYSKLDTHHEISGFFLPQNIVSLSFNPFKEELFYLLKNQKGVTGVIRNLVANTKKTIFESAYSEWLAFWNAVNSIELTTKSSYQALGYSYELNSRDGDYHKSFPQKNGLTTLAGPNNLNILISESLDDTVRTSLVDRTSGRIVPLDIQTFVEKCTWSHDGKKIYCAVPDALAYGNEYPDIWYQGLENYNDSLWVIDSITNKAEVLSNIPDEFGENLDIFKIGVDKEEEYLYFIDKKTEFLWSYRLQDA